MEQFVVTVPESMKAFVQAEIVSGGYGGPNDYICHLLRAEQKRKAKEVLERLVQEALDSPSEEITPAFWDGLRERVIQKSAAREAAP